MQRSSKIDAIKGATTLDRGLTILEVVEKASHPVTIQEISLISGIQRLAAYRLLSTLEARGYVQRLPDKRYRGTRRRRRVLLGYAAPLSGNTFREDVASSLRVAAAASGVDLVQHDNRADDAQQVMRNARALVDERVDLAIFFQPAESLGHMMADHLANAGVPFITVERPIQGGVYFGANNYLAGKLAGQALGRYAIGQWRGSFDHVVLLEGNHTSTNVHARSAGVLVGLREVLGDLDERCVIHLHGNPSVETTQRAMAELLRGLPAADRLLVSGFNDLSATGAANAVRAEGRECCVAIVGQNAMGEGRAQILQAGSPFIASVAYFPERYGQKLVEIATRLLDGETVPPAVYTDHLVIDRANIATVYPEEAQRRDRLRLDAAEAAEPKGQMTP